MRRTGGCFIKDADAVAISAISVRRHRQPTILHAQWQQQILANPLIVQRVREAVDKFAEDVPGGVRVVAGFHGRHPIAFDFHRVDFLKGFVPGGKGVSGVKAAQAGGVRKEMPHRERFLGIAALAYAKGSVSREFWNVLRNGVIESELAAVDEHADGGGGERFAGGEPEHERLGAHGGGRFEAGLAEGEIGDRLAVYHDEGCADMKSGGEARFNDGSRFRQVV